ncbi:MAG: hypothetical protein WA374_01780 [Acidobacteriaceae bacterium]
MGLILPALGIPYLAKITAGISRALSEEKYGLIVSSSENDLDAEQKQIGIFLSLQLDALLLVSLQETASFFEEFQARTDMPDRAPRHGNLRCSPGFSSTFKQLPGPASS